MVPYGLYTRIHDGGFPDVGDLIVRGAPSRCATSARGTGRTINRGSRAHRAARRIFKKAARSAAKREIRIALDDA